jgi:hypothetical protein
MTANQCEIFNGGNVAYSAAAKLALCHLAYLKYQ